MANEKMEDATNEPLAALSSVDQLLWRPTRRLIWDAQCGKEAAV